MVMERSAEEQRGKRGGGGGGWRKDMETKQLCGFIPQRKTINLLKRSEDNNYDLKCSIQTRTSAVF